MDTIRAPITDRRSDRQILHAMAVIGGLSVLMLVVELLGNLAWGPSFDLAFFWAEIAAEIFVIAAIVWAGPLTLREIASLRQAGLAALETRAQVETLFKMTDMLQSATGYADANAVLRSTAAQLLPGLGGALYVFNNSGDRLELSTAWSCSEDSVPPEAIGPTQCWALKRGKNHINLAGDGALVCQHYRQGTVLEIPMMARGEVYGLLALEIPGDDPLRQLNLAEPIATALADAMSLALSNIALREKLRTQALRDALTGLYNRRYMEDVLERYANLAERNVSGLALIMFDLDHFKQLNDEHGHALGDAVLTSVAAAVLGALRPCDVACRYGGEEFVVLLPDCSMGDAAAKAEILRVLIEQLSGRHGARISASFGIAGIPESSSKVAGLLADADAALYKAKADGRNRVVACARRPMRSIGRQVASAA